MQSDLISLCDETRRRQGFLGIRETMALVDQGTVILDPFSTLISPRVRLGRDNVIYPGVTLGCAVASDLEIGSRNTFHSGTYLSAEAGAIRIGDGNQFGEGGFIACANRAGARIHIGDRGRYLRGAAVYGEAELGSGSQILGAIAVDSCRLGPGDAHTDPEPDRRGGVLKGFGTARNLVVETGEVIAGNGIFSAADLKPQSFFHPAAKR